MREIVRRYVNLGYLLAARCAIQTEPEAHVRKPLLYKRLGNGTGQATQIVHASRSLV